MEKCEGVRCKKCFRIGLGIAKISLNPMDLEKRPYNISVSNQNKANCFEDTKTHNVYHL